MANVSNWRLLTTDLLNNETSASTNPAEALKKE